MKTTINLDQALLARAQELTGISDRDALMQEALQALIAREAARRLARLAGSMPEARRVPRRRA